MPLDATDAIVDQLAEVAAKVHLGRPLSISEAALWLGVDRNTLAANLRLVPFGDHTRLAVGEVPCRAVGTRKLVFPGDVLASAPAPTGAFPGPCALENNHVETATREGAPANPHAGRRNDDRPLDQLRHWRRRPG
jgi:hypothetical protein